MSEILISNKLAEKIIEKTRELNIINSSEKEIAREIVAEAKKYGESPTFSNKAGEPDVGITVYVEDIHLSRNGSSIFEVHFSFSGGEGITFGTRRKIEKKLGIGNDYLEGITLPFTPIPRYLDEITCKLNLNGTLSISSGSTALFLMPEEIQKIDEQLATLLRLK